MLLDEKVGSIVLLILARDSIIIVEHGTYLLVIIVSNEFDNCYLIFSSSEVAHAVPDCYDHASE